MSANLYPPPHKPYSTLNDFLKETRAITALHFASNLVIQKRTNNVLVLVCSLGIKRPSRMSIEDKKRNDWCE